MDDHSDRRIEEQQEPAGDRGTAGEGEVLTVASLLELAPRFPTVEVTMPSLLAQLCLAAYGMELAGKLRGEAALCAALLLRDESAVIAVLRDHHVAEEKWPRLDSALGLCQALRFAEETSREIACIVRKVGENPEIARDTALALLAAEITLTPLYRATRAAQGGSAAAGAAKFLVGVRRGKSHAEAEIADQELARREVARGARRPEARSSTVVFTLPESEAVLVRAVLAYSADRLHLQRLLDARAFGNVIDAAATYCSPFARKPGTDQLHFPDASPIALVVCQCPPCSARRLIHFQLDEIPAERFAEGRVPAEIRRFLLAENLGFCACGCNRRMDQVHHLAPQRVQIDHRIGNTVGLAAVCHQRGAERGTLLFTRRGERDLEVRDGEGRELPGRDPYHAGKLDPAIYREAATDTLEAVARGLRPGTVSSGHAPEVALPELDLPLAKRLLEDRAAPVSDELRGDGLRAGAYYAEQLEQQSQPGSTAYADAITFLDQERGMGRWEAAHRIKAGRLVRDFPLLGSLDVIARLPQSRLFALAETKLGPEYDVQLTCLGLLLPVDELRHAVKVMERKARATTGAERLTELRLRLGDDDILAFRNYVSLVRSLSREERTDGDCLPLAARSFLAGRWMGPEITDEQNQTRRSSMQFALGSPAHAASTSPWVRPKWTRLWRWATWCGPCRRPGENSEGRPRRNDNPARVCPCGLSAKRARLRALFALCEDKAPPLVVEVARLAVGAVADYGGAIEPLEVRPITSPPGADGFVNCCPGHVREAVRGGQAYVWNRARGSLEEVYSCNLKPGNGLPRPPVADAGTRGMPPPVWRARAGP